MSDNPNPTPEGDQPKGDEGKQEQTFTQADLDRIVRERVQRERAKYADYDDLKVKAGEKATAEDRIRDLESKFAESEARALRAEIANAKGLTPSQAKRLVGSSREELEADADELLADIGAAKKTNNVVPREGANPKAGEDEMRSFTRNLFERAASD